MHKSFLLIFLFVFTVYGGTYYISPTGRPKASGSQNDPFRAVESAFSAVGGGHAFIFCSGIYSDQITLKPEHKGTPQNPTILKSQEKYKAILHGSANYAIYVRKGTDWVIIDGFEVRCAANDGILCDADYTVIRNCWVRHNMGQGIIAHDVTGSVFERNLVEFNGSNIQFDHGIYASGKNLIIRQNIIRFNSSHGIHLYPSAKNCRIETNLVYGNTRSGILVWCSEEGGQNYILQNTIVKNGYALDFNNGKDEVIANNIIVDNTRWNYSVSNHALVLRNTELQDIKMYNNLIYPNAETSDANTIFMEPQFLDSQQGAFFLKSTSPAIKKGSPKWTPAQDFWGRERTEDTPSDLGCFSYDQSLLDKEYREGWHYGWPFKCSFINDELPDLWKLPGNEDPKAD